MFMRHVLAGGGAVALLAVSATAGLEGDDPETAISISLNETIAFDTTQYTPTGGAVSSAACSDAPLNWAPTLQNRDIWFSFTPEFDGLVTFSTCWPGGFDTSMVLYQGGSTNAALVACNGDAPFSPDCQSGHSYIEYEATAGLTYFVRIGGRSAAAGPAALTVAPDACADAEPATINVATVAELVGAINAACDGDRILMAPGTYNITNTISFVNTDAITIEGTLGKGGEHLTVLDGGNSRQIMSVEARSSTLRNLVFQNARATEDGGALNCLGLGLIENCVFQENTASLGGGAICLRSPQNTLIEGCVFRNNNALFAGAIFHAQDSTTNPTSPTIRNSEFLSNSAIGTGGAVASGGCGPRYEGCVFIGNVNQVNPPGQWAWAGGGAMHFNAGGQPFVIGCTFSENSVAGGQCGGAIWSGGSTTRYGDNLMCANTCNGSINHVSGSLINLGGNQLLAECPVEPCIGDINQDGLVSSADLGVMIAQWGCTSGCQSDLNMDGLVNSADLGLLISNWGPCPE